MKIGEQFENDVRVALTHHNRELRNRCQNRSNSPESRVADGFGYILAAFEFSSGDEQTQSLTQLSKFSSIFTTSVSLLDTVLEVPPILQRL